MSETRDFDAARAEMVQRQLIERGIRSPRVLAAMRVVPRHLFVPERLQHLAYSDGPLAIGEDQTISQPYVVGLMTELLELEPDDKVLEIGTGSGYQAAILAKLAGEVYSVERFESLGKAARVALRNAGADNVRVFIEDGSQGLQEHAPYDAVVVTAAAPAAPRALLEQMADGGRLVLPIGDRRGQRLQRIRRKGDRFTRSRLVPVAFVPLRGRYGWSEDRWS
ncbi:MAG TPA: protein-L-isoaspartate(D-aspartate) O-methyltransferase [Anaerolineales bacterium]|nr:protein-L-isoaspartate(D-aspartate) O-methyltransferase [Anaerolineales bacterium]